MRFLLVIVLLSSLLGCSKPPIEPCTSEYQHLITIANQKENKGLKRRFIAVCMTAWDLERHQCIMKAKTVSRALACRPGKIYPG